jgi:membrane peptidoglycan carboxypeptidase
MGRWHQRFWASTLWMSQQRTAAQLTQSVMDGAYYGRGAKGLDAASLAYFERPSGALAPHEIALLVALESSPSRYNVDCHPAESIAARNHLLGRLLSAGAMSRLDHDAAVAQGLGVVPRACEPTQPTRDGDGAETR